MQQYSYKNSGIKWLGKVPEHWKADRIKDHCRNDVVGGWHSKEQLSEYWDDGEHNLGLTN
jgi:hypothetical protein